MSKAAKDADTQIITGDIKVVEKGAADKIFINTSGIGLITYLSRASFAAGDSGTTKRTWMGSVVR